MQKHISSKSSNLGDRPDSEVLAKVPKRKIYTTAYKLSILDRAEVLRRGGNGQLNGFLRSEGLYSSHLSQWGRLKSKGLLIDQKRGKAGKGASDLAQEISRLKSKIIGLEKRARQAEFLVDFQKKIAELFGGTQALEKGIKTT